MDIEKYRHAASAAGWFALATLFHFNIQISDQTLALGFAGAGLLAAIRYIA